MRFSIVTPSFNQGRYIQECLTSVQEAGRRAGVEVEHFVMDAGSADETVAILSKQKDAQWVSEPDKGQTDAINKGLRRATGDILAYLCADDYLEPETLRLVREVFEQSPDVDVVYGDGYFLESDSGWKRPKKAGEFSVERLRNGNFVIQPAVFWRRRVYERFGEFDASLRYCMDQEYWLRIAADSRWAYIPTPLATCRLHSDAKTSSALAAAWAESAKMQQRYGIVGKPWWEALWMKFGGQYYYRLKRRIFAAIGRYRAARS